MEPTFKKKIKGGYIWVYKPDHKYSLTKKGWIVKHRAVVEDFIKKPLKREEVVHHIDEHKQHNKIENLMVFKDQKEHMKFHTKMKQFGITIPMLRQIENRWSK